MNAHSPSLTIIFFRFYIGRQPCVLVADLEMLKRVMAGEYESFLHRKVGGRNCCGRDWKGQLYVQLNNKWSSNVHLPMSEC